ncbi:AlpA family phage regulatory protein [Marinicella meishanensis]|uniref:helix-turn-helix transcriptional regulator n=1 Tax=Marinicella meishanensis TaxID=2873263 RepID=UPI001CBBF79D
MQNFLKVYRPIEVARIFGVSLSTIDRWAKENPNFPRKVKLGGRAVGYDHAQIIEFFEKCKEGCNQ